MEITKKNVDLCRVGVARRRAKSRHEVQYSGSVSYSMRLLEAAELDPQLYVTLALDRMSISTRHRNQLREWMEPFCTYPAGKVSIQFSSVFSQTGIFTADRDAMREDLIVNDIVKADAVVSVDIEAALRHIPSYRFPGMGPKPLIWTPHLRAHLARR